MTSNNWREFFSLCIMSSPSSELSLPFIGLGLRGSDAIALVLTLIAENAADDFSSILVAQNGVPMPGMRAGKIVWWATPRKSIVNIQNEL